MTVTGIAGTAKNTGKTTTLNAILSHIRGENISCAVTGIGYDGEIVDSITGLPKPRINLHQGVYYCTAEACFNTAYSTLIERTGIGNPLGELLIGQVTKDAVFTVAGPQTLKAAEQIIDRMRQLNPAHLLIDGSLNRVYPLTTVKRLLIATGCSRSTDLHRLEREMAVMEALFCLPDYHAYCKHEPAWPLLSAGDLEKIIDRSIPGSVLRLRGHIATPLLLRLLQHTAVYKKVVLPSPFSLLLQENGVPASTFLNDYQDLLAVENRPQLLCFTLNPFYPEFNGTHYAGRKKNLRELWRTGSIPRVDLLAQPDFFKALTDQWFTKSPMS